MRIGNLEIEARFRVKEIKNLEARLLDLAGRPLETWRGRDIMFDDKRRGLKKKGLVLRLRIYPHTQKIPSFKIRKNGQIEMSSSEKSKFKELGEGVYSGWRGKLTFKGPNQDKIFKKRQEEEIITDDWQKMVKILGHLGFFPTIYFEKRTRLWRYGRTEIIVEELPEIGYFMEIEGRAKDIKKVAGMFGYEIKESTLKSYPAYFREIDKNKKEWLFKK